MTDLAQTFDSKVLFFKENQTTPWYRLRYSISFANVQRHLDGRSLRFLDVGGGNGLDTIRYAADGHTVTLLDISSEMLKEARRNAEAYGVADRVTFCQADLADIPPLFPDPTFDVVLCHNVIEYIDDMPAMLRAMCHALLPNGLISIMGINRFSESYRQALQRLDLNAAYSNLDTRTYFTPVFETSIRLYAAEDLIPTLQDMGCSLVGRYGIRCVCDYIPDNETKTVPTFFAHLERLEHAMSDKYPYYLIARLYQVIARKAVSETKEAA